MAHDVFISYSKHDKTIADAVCASLESNGIRCWIAPRDPSPGGDWGAEIVQAIDNSKVFVLVFSGHCNGSVHVRNELIRAINRSIPVLPFRIEDKEPNGAMALHLSGVHWLDAMSEPLEEHLSRLLNTVTRITPQRTVRSKRVDAENVRASVETESGREKPSASKNMEVNGQSEKQVFDSKNAYFLLGISYIFSTVGLSSVIVMLSTPGLSGNSLSPFELATVSGAIIGSLVGIIIQFLSCLVIVDTEQYKVTWIALGILPLLGPIILLRMAPRSIEQWQGHIAGEQGIELKKGYSALSVAYLFFLVVPILMFLIIKLIVATWGNPPDFIETFIQNIFVFSPLAGTMAQLIASFHFVQMKGYRSILSALGIIPLLGPIIILLMPTKKIEDS